MTTNGPGVVSAHQPSYFPWLGLLHKIMSSDVYVLMDDVQLADRNYQHRNLFLGCNGIPRFLTLPISKKGLRKKVIRELPLANSEWQTDHLNFLSHNYRRAPFYAETMAAIAPVFQKPYTLLIDVLIDSMLIAFDQFGIVTPMLRQSNLDYNHDSRKRDLILALVQASGASRYLSGEGARKYLDLEEFKSKGVEVTFQQFCHPTYHQFTTSAAAFVAGMSSVDVMFNLGPQGCRDLLSKLELVTRA